jgi:hypothetical protein
MSGHCQPWERATVVQEMDRCRRYKIVGGTVRRCRDGPHSPWAPGSAEEKELVLAALTMTQEEFNKLAADRNELIVESSGDDHPNSDAPLPDNELVVALSDLFTANESVDTSGNDEGVLVLGEEGGV